MKLSKKTCCENCLFWDKPDTVSNDVSVKGTAICYSKHFRRSSPSLNEDVTLDVLLPNHFANLGSIQTGPYFGCVHFKAKS